MDSRNFAIGILSTTAVILLVGILVIHSRPAPAFASGMAASGGAYLLTVGAIQVGDEELVFVTHASRSSKMNVYRFNVGKAQIERVDRINLKEMQDAAGKQPSKKGGKRSRRRNP